MDYGEFIPIGQMAKICNTSVKTIRFYSDTGLIKPEYVHPENNYRYYSFDQVELFFLIKDLKDLGFSLDEIKGCIKMKGLKGIAGLIKEKGREVEQELLQLSRLQARLDALAENYQSLMTEEMVGKKQAISTKKVAERQILYINKKTSYDGMSFKAASEQLYSIAEACNCRIKDVMMAILHDPYVIFNADMADIDFCYELSGDAYEQSEHVKIIGEGLFASMIYCGRYEEMRREGYPLLYEWISRNGYEPGGGTIEIYHLTRPISMIAGDFITEVQIPIKNL